MQRFGDTSREITAKHALHSDQANNAEPVSANVIAHFRTEPGSGYNLARMRFEIVLAPEAIQDRKRLKANV